MQQKHILLIVCLEGFYASSVSTIPPRMPVAQVFTKVEASDAVVVITSQHPVLGLSISNVPPPFPETNSEFSTENQCFWKMEAISADFQRWTCY